MVTGHVEDQLGAYALGCLDVSAAKQVAAHLEHCATCRAHLDAYEGVVAQLGYALPVADPSPATKDALLERVSARRSPVRARFPRVGPVLTVVNWVAVIALAVTSFALWQRVQALESRAQVVVLSATAEAPGAAGLFVLDAEYDGVLLVQDLPSLGEERQYQLWLVDSDGGRTSGGVFSVGVDGSATLRVESPAPLSTYAALGITVEPYGGSSGPTGARVLGCSL